MSDSPAVLYTEFVEKEIRPLLKSKDYGERKIGFVRAALLHSWMDFMKDMNSRDLAMLEAGFELVIEESDHWKDIEKAIPDVHMRRVARRMGYSAAYVSDLELGKRNWSQELLDKYQRALEVIE